MWAIVVSGPLAEVSGLPSHSADGVCDEVISG